MTTRWHWTLLTALGMGLAPEMSEAQERKNRSTFRTWYMVFGDHPIGDGPLGLHFDGQFRAEDLGGTPQQLLLRPGLNFDVTPSLQLSGGYAFIRDEPGGDARARAENRLWQQVLLRQALGSTRWTHRYRLEQRFLGIPVGEERTEVRYQNRFRYFLKGTVPLSAEGAHYLALYNELLIGFGRNVTDPFDQNRSYAALGLALGDAWSLEAGYLLQIVQRPGGQIVDFNHTLQLALFSSARLN